MSTPTGILFSNPLAQPLSTVGQLQAGSYLLFFLTGTLTPANVYYDGALTTPLSQTPGASQPSCTANSAGAMNAIYLNPATVYRVQLYNALGVKLYDVDPYVIPFSTQTLWPQTSAESSASVTPSSYLYPGANFIGGGNVFRYGAKGDGSTDDSTAFTNAAATNYTFSVPPATGYKTNTALTGAYSFVAQGNPTYSGTNAPLAWTPGFGGALQVAAVNASGSGTNALVAMVRNSLSANFTSFPTAVTAMGRNDNGGNTVFGLYAPAYQYATTGCVTGAEIDTFNMTASPSANLPPNRAIGTPQNVPVCLTVAAGGNYASAIGIQLAKEGSSPQQMLTGIYINPGTCATYGLFIDATLADTATSAVIKHSSSQVGLQVQGNGGILGFAITGVSGQCSCTATNLSVGQRVTIAGTFGGTGSISGYSTPTTYKISATNGSTTFTLQTLGGGALTTVAGSPTGITVTAITPTGAALYYSDANGVTQFQVTQTGNISGGGGLGIYGNAAAAQSTGWGAATGASVQNNYSGGGATLGQTSAAVAQIITVLQAVGILGA